MKNLKRTNSRIKAMVALYYYDLNKENINEEHLDYLINEAENQEIDNEFYIEIVSGVLNNLREINRIININLTNWTIDRISYVDRNLLRIATYEMLYTNTPKQIIINEALNLTHIYSELDDKSESKFNNKVLDQIGKYLDGK